MRSYLLFYYQKSITQQANVTPVSELNGCYLQHVLNFFDNFRILSKQKLERNVIERGILSQL